MNVDIYNDLRLDDYLYSLEKWESDYQQEYEHEHNED